MRIVLVGAARAAREVQGRMLAERLGVPYLALAALPPARDLTARLERELAAHLTGFVLDGFPADVAEASALDRFLGVRAADVEVALHVTESDAAPPAADDALLEHYRGRVVELDATGDPDEVHERVLAGLREALVAA